MDYAEKTHRLLRNLIIMRSTLKYSSISRKTLEYCGFSRETLEYCGISRKTLEYCGFFEEIRPTFFPPESARYIALDFSFYENEKSTRRRERNEWIGCVSGLGKSAASISFPVSLLVRATCYLAAGKFNLWLSERNSLLSPTNGSHPLFKKNIFFI